MKKNPKPQVKPCTKMKSSVNPSSILKSRCRTITSASMRAVTLPLCLWFLAIVTLGKSFCYGSSDVICNESERQALLQFKQDLKDPSNRLSSWDVDEDCCKWAGVVCDHLTGHVQEIRLSNPYTEIENEAFSRFKLGGEINPSLLNLTQLEHLDLSCNGFEGIQIPSFIGSLRHLSYLNLSQAGFRGEIPYQLGNLSMMRYLSVGGVSEYGEAELSAKNLQWLSGLSSLQHLDMRWVNLSNAFDQRLQVINTLPSLVELHLSSCDLNYLPPLPNISFTSLSTLDLSKNNFDSLVPGWIFRLSSLVYLNISDCGFYGPIPGAFQNMTSLRMLDVSNNHLDSSIPDWLYNSSRLEFLNLRGNYLQGAISNAIQNMVSLITLDFSFNQLQEAIPRSLGSLCNLRKIALSGNNFDGEVSAVFGSFSGCVLDGLESLEFEYSYLFGHIPDQLSQFQNLTYLSLQSNSISGPIPESIGKLLSLQILDLSHNQLQGTLPESIGQLSKLETLVISHNLLNGNVTDVQFANLGRLKTLDAHGNKLALTLRGSWIPPFQLEFLRLSSWQLGPQFPLWLQSQKNILFLEMSNTGISYTIPTWFWTMFSNLRYLNLSHNKIHGEIPSLLEFGLEQSTIDLGFNCFEGQLPLISPGVTLLDFSNNFFSGSIDRFLCNRMDKPNKLVILDLSHNLLSEEIPDCWMNWQQLGAIKLEENNLMGSVPTSMGYLSALQSLHLHHNNLSGELPISLQNCTQLVVIDFCYAGFSGTIPTWIGKQLSNLIVLNLRDNKFHGTIPHELCRLTSLQILDLAGNKLLGTIPRCFSNFSGMIRKQNLSDPFIYSVPYGKMLEYALLVIKGKLVEYSTILKLVTGLDLSRNSLSGEIPSEVMSLIGLRSLNLSENHFTGRIPERTGDMGLLESLDLSWNRLSGEIPQSMSTLTFLSHLNLSYNNLTGKIPSSTQLQSFDESSFVGNKLCGPPLTDNCDGNGVRSDVKHGGKEDGVLEVDWFTVTSISLGFVTGLWAVLGVLLFNLSWRSAYFQFLDKLGYRLLNAISKCFKF